MAPPRRRHRGLVITLIVVLVLVGLVVAADRVGEQVAENLAAEKLQSSQNLPSKPDVDITGFPFLTQFAASEYDEVDVTADDIPLGSGERALRFSQVRVELDKLRTSKDFSTFHVERADAVGTVNYAELGRALGVDLKYVGNGKVTASKKITVFGQTITPTVTARTAFAGGALSFVATAANGLGPLAGELADVAAQVFGSNIPLDGIPFQVSIKDVGLTSEGLRIDMTGADLTYRR